MRKVTRTQFEEEDDDMVRENHIYSVYNAEQVLAFVSEL